MADRSDYPVFVSARWARLLRTAYLLVQDWAAAEDLTQAALVKAWLAWPRLDDDPEASSLRFALYEGKPPAGPRSAAEPGSAG